VVDDEPEIARLLERILQARGFLVTACTSGQEALASFKRDPNAFDVVITDYTMPRVTGLDLSREIKTLRPELPVVLATGYGDRLTSESLAPGVDAVAAKPFDANALVETLRRLLDRPTPSA
jgi:CheY-like chemotaxis protein